MSTNPRPFAMFCTAVCLLSCWQTAMGEGVLLIKSHEGQRAQFWTPVGFETLTKHPASVLVRLGDRREQSFRNDQIGDIIEAPDFSKMTVVSADDWEKFHQQRRVFHQKMSSLPQIEDYLRPIVAAFDSAIQNRSDDRVIYRGRWTPKATFETVAQSETPLAQRLAIGSKTYSNVRVTSVKDGRIGLIHDGGIASIHIDDLNSSQIGMLKTISPDLFGTYIAKAEEERKMQIMKAQLAQAEREKEITIRADEVEEKKAEAMKATQEVEKQQDPRMSPALQTQVTNAKELAHLALKHETGQGAPEDLGKAIQLYSKAAELGYSPAQVKLGSMYENGQGVSADPKKALELYQSAADQGDALGQNSLGYMYVRGHGVPLDFPKAAELFEAAANQGLPFAQNNLAMLYMNGQGVPRDLAKAASIFRLAADQGDVNAMVNLGLLLLQGESVPKDLEKAESLFLFAAHEGNPQAMFNLGWMHETGEGRSKDLQQARTWYEKAAAADNRLAVDAIARLDALVTGRGGITPENMSRTPNADLEIIEKAYYVAICQFELNVSETILWLEDLAKISEFPYGPHFRNLSAEQGISELTRLRGKVNSTERIMSDHAAKANAVDSAGRAVLEQKPELNDLHSQIVPKTSVSISIGDASFIHRLRGQQAAIVSMKQHFTKYNLANATSKGHSSKWYSATNGPKVGPLQYSFRILAFCIPVAGLVYLLSGKPKRQTSALNAAQSSTGQAQLRQEASEGNALLKFLGNSNTGPLFVCCVAFGWIGMWLAPLRIFVTAPILPVLMLAAAAISLSAKAGMHLLRIERVPFKAAIGALFVTMISTYLFYRYFAWIITDHDFIKGGNKHVLIGRTILDFLAWSRTLAESEVADVGPFKMLIGMTFGVGLLEELIKSIPVIWIITCLKNHGFSNRDLITIGLFSGLGFGIAENLSNQYSPWGTNRLEGGILVNTQILRWFACAPSHGIYAAIDAAFLCVILSPFLKSSGGRNSDNSPWLLLGIISLAIFTVALVHGVYNTFNSAFPFAGPMFDGASIVLLYLAATLAMKEDSSTTEPASEGGELSWRLVLLGRQRVFIRLYILSAAMIIGAILLFSSAIPYYAR